MKKQIIILIASLFSNITYSMKREANNLITLAIVAEAVATGATNDHQIIEYIMQNTKKSHEGKFLCPVCGCYRSSDRHNFRRHMERRHTALRPFVCPICKHNFLKRYELIRHTNSCRCQPRR